MPSSLTYPAYPSSDDVLTLLSGAEITVPDNLDVDGLIAEAIDEWELATRYRPFLGDSAAKDFAYDPPGPNKEGCWRGGGTTLFFGRGFVADDSAPITITADVTSDDPTGTVLVEGTDYDLLPQNAIADGVPFTAVQFRRRRYGAPRSIVVNGTAGYAIEIPANAWGAIRKDGAAKVLEAMREQMASDGVVMEQSASGTKVQYDAALTQGATWKSDALRVRQSFTRMN